MVVDRGAFTINLGGEAQFRVVMRMALGLLAYHEPDMARRPELEAARRAARHGNPLVMIDPGARTPSVFADLAVPRFGNVIELWTTELQRGSASLSLVARVLLAGHFSYVFPLSHTWAGAPIVGRYVVDPIAGTHEPAWVRSGAVLDTPWWTEVSRATGADLHATVARAQEALHAYNREQIAVRLAEPSPAPPAIDRDQLVAMAIAKYAEYSARRKR